MKRIVAFLVGSLIATSALADTCATKLMPTFTAFQATAICSSFGSGNFTLKNNTYLKARNAAGTADLSILKSDASDNTILNAGTGKTVNLDINSAAILTVSASKLLGSGTAAMVNGATLGTVIGLNTADAADAQALCLAAGNACPGDFSRGGEISIFGNESASAGDISIFGGIAAGSNIRISTGLAAAQVSLENNGNAALIVDNNGVSSPLTGSIGWSIVAAANTACNTTCTSACVFGINTAISDDIVNCADATADRCLCAGAS